MSAPPSSTIELVVPFHDCDPLRVVWHGHYLKYFELARESLFEKHGINLYEYYQKTTFLFPVARISTKYVHALRYRDVFTCEARLIEARTKIVVEYTASLKETGTDCARGRSEQVAVRGPGFELELSIPDDIQRAFGLAPPEGSSG